MAVSAENRRARILEVVRELGTVRVADLATRLDMPTVTVRRDVATLAEAGLLRRSHGSATLPDTGAAGSAGGGLPGLAGPAGVTGAAAGAAGVPDGRGRVIGMMVPTVGSYFDEIIEGARSAATAAGARLVLGISPYEARDDRGQVARTLESGVDGLLLTPNWLPGGPAEESDWLSGLPVPAVLVERRAAPGSAAAELDAVGSDHRHGVLLALRHLAGLGHRTVLLAARNDTWTAHEVRTGYAEAVRTLGLEARPPLDLHHPGSSPLTPTDPEWVADQLAIGAQEGVRAVLVHNDRDAIQLPPLLRARGLRVPEDIALVSYDDVFAALTTPPLTAVAPPKRAVGAVALDLLLRRLGPADLPAHHIGLLPTLKVRASCGALTPQD
ncbi:DeoR/GlpR family transcriptional regulator [Kitasatospora sp. RG8]|uniref:substrate-binding domain-containing protein n=1 Tax=Kitasatospora sp. RG8 TaxID=2820815 RepID=UPI001AE04273|nr:substrate-binding domain-containing protein [Kitasatospora sp. RG8]MBP0455197.1 DeoR/GlpR family transcriptional regulator [Kitasatospora sp. RG8]